MTKAANPHPAVPEPTIDWQPLRRSLADVGGVVCEPFPLPGYYRRVYGLAVGPDCTVAVWIAHDLETDAAYIYSEHYSSADQPAVHCQAIQRRAAWIPGVIDPAGGGRSQSDGEALLRTYRSLGLQLSAMNDSAAAAREVRAHLSSGRLKVFRTCQRWIDEFGGAAGTMLAATGCAVSGLGIATLRPREQWTREMIGIKPAPRHQVACDPFGELYAGIDSPPRSNSPRRG